MKLPSDSGSLAIVALALLGLCYGCQGEQAVTTPEPEPPLSDDLGWLETEGLDNAACEDSTCIRLIAVAQRRSVLLTWPLLWAGEALPRYQLYRRAAPQSEFSPIRCQEYTANTWGDFNVVEREVYQYRLVALGPDDQVIASSPIVEVTVRFPEGVLRDIVTAYRRRDAAMLARCLSADFQCLNRRPSGCYERWDRDTEIRLHEHMFDPKFPRNAMQALEVDLETIECRSVRFNSEPCWRFLEEVRLALTLDPTTTRLGDDSITIRTRTEFIVKRDPNDYTRWVVCSWGDVDE